MNGLLIKLGCVMEDYPGERRVVNLLSSYFKDIKDINRCFPDLKDINEDDISDIWTHCFIVGIKEKKEDEDIDNNHPYFCIHLGDSAASAFSDMIVGEDKDEKFSSLVEELRDNLDSVMENLEPCIVDSEGCKDRSCWEENVKFRYYLSPLGPDDETVNAIIGAVTSRKY